MFRELFGSLFGRRPVSAEEVVFEPLDAAASEKGSPETVGRSVAVEKILKRIPPAWRQPGGDAVHEVLVLPPEALLAGEDPRAPRVSLRYLSRFYPSTFRDPGVMEPDPGVSLAEGELQDPALGLAQPEAGLAALPAETVSEVATDPATFSDWEGERSVAPQKRQEERETRRALRGVRLPPAREAGGGDFDTTLTRTAAQQEVREEEGGSGPAQPPAPGGQDSKAAVPNLRLRRILAAYAETLPEFASAQPPEPVSVPASQRNPPPSAQAQPTPEPPSGSKGRVQIPLTRGGVSPDKTAATREPESATAGEEALAPSRSGPDARWERRFAELESSLGRFTQVSGFVLWERGAAAHAGRPGFDPQQPGVREELERLLLSGERFGGGRDAFSSLTFYSAAGGFSVFGAGDCLVVVSHRGGEGISEGLRGWLCGWVAQAAVRQP